MFCLNCFIRSQFGGRAFLFDTDFSFALSALLCASNGAE